MYEQFIKIILVDYNWLKAFHTISVICWMAGLFYLPRLYVYHSMVETGSAQSEMFKSMERRLLNYITTPAAIASSLFGLWMLLLIPEYFFEWWFILKFVAVSALFVSQLLRWYRCLQS